MKILNDFFASAYITQSLIRYIIYIKNIEQPYRSGPVFFFFDKLNRFFNHILEAIGESYRLHQAKKRSRRRSEQKQNPDSEKRQK